LQEVLRYLPVLYLLLDLELLLVELPEGQALLVVDLICTKDLPRKTKTKRRLIKNPVHGKSEV